MINRKPRNQSLMARISATNPLRDTVAQRAFQILNNFEKDIAAIGEDGRSSAAWKQELAKQRVKKAQDELLNDVEKPIADYRKQTESMRSGMKAPTYDRTDLVAAQNRQRYLDRFVGLSFGQKSALMSGPRRSVGLIDSILEFKDDPWMAGINIDNPNEREAFEMMKQERSRDLNGSLMDALEARAGNESEIAMIANVVKNDIASDAADLTARAA
jgi:hypothetical protein